MKRLLNCIIGGALCAMHLPVGADESTLWSRFISGSLFSATATVTTSQPVIEDNYLEQKTPDATYRQSTISSPHREETWQPGVEKQPTTDRFVNISEKTQGDIQTALDFITIEPTR
jgi:pectin methylesterase-like acyl-CoA thioesterase